MMLGIELASKVKWEVGMVLRYQLCICVTYDAASGVLIASAEEEAVFWINTV
jgi:hypothetical protein